MLFIILSVNCGQQVTKEQNDLSLLSYVDPFIGTGFHGHTFPGPTLPHSRVQLSPDTHIMGWDASSGYHYDDTTLYGFSHTHLSGTGIGDLGDILMLPYTGSPEKKEPEGVLDHQQEEASPGYYKVNVLPWQIQAELTTGRWTGWHRYTYPKGEEAKLMVDLAHILQPNWGHRLIDSQLKILDDYTIWGYRLTSGWAQYDPIWFTCKFNHPIAEMNLYNDTPSDTLISLSAHISFGRLNSPLECVVAISSVDSLGAHNNLEAEVNLTFDKVHHQAKQIWNQELQKIKIESNDPQVLRNFYTALYHTKIAPLLLSDVDGRYRGLDQQIHQPSSNAYTAYSLWDTFRSWIPLMSIIEPDLFNQWVMDLYSKYLQGGLLPKWPLNSNYTGTMVGYPACALIADGIVKGLVPSNSEDLLKACVTSSSWQPEFVEKHLGTRAQSVMAQPIYYKEKYGIIPKDSANGSVSYGLEMAYYDWCISVIAKQLGDSELAEQYYQKGQAYRKYYDPNKGFMHGVNLDGTFSQLFNPNYSDHEHSEFIEGNAWQWTPTVMHDFPGLAELMGGSVELGVWMDSLFTTSSVIEGENASGDITGLIGQYAHGNEPSHHVPFIYTYTDRPWKAQPILDTILYHFYNDTPDGIIGNEDCGQMSAWYVLNALGIYQVTPGDATFTIGRPIVESAKIQIKDGGIFKITVKNNSRINKYVQAASINGSVIVNNQFEYDQIIPGGHLKITMGPDPKH